MMDEIVISYFPLRVSERAKLKVIAAARGKPLKFFLAEAIDDIIKKYEKMDQDNREK